MHRKTALEIDKLISDLYKGPYVDVHEDAKDMALLVLCAVLSKLIGRGRFND